jgi:hypothetical protein
VSSHTSEKTGVKKALPSTDPASVRLSLSKQQKSRQRGEQRTAEVGSVKSQNTYHVSAHPANASLRPEALLKEETNILPQGKTRG